MVLSINDNSQTSIIDVTVPCELDIYIERGIGYRVIINSDIMMSICRLEYDPESGEHVALSEEESKIKRLSYLNNETTQIIVQWNPGPSFECNGCVITYNDNITLPTCVYVSYNTYKANVQI